MKFRKGDSVVVAKGKDRGKKGTIERVFRKRGLAIVGGVNLAKKHLKPNAGNKEGGIIDKAMPIRVDNLRIFCKKCNQGRRVGFKFIGERKVRICRKCQAEI